MSAEKKTTSETMWKAAMFIVIPYAAAHMLGFRSHTSVLAGTNTGGPLVYFAGTAYLFFHVSAVYLAPIFTLAGLFLWIGQRLELHLRQRE